MRVDGGTLGGRDLKSIMEGRARGGKQARIHRKRRRPGEKVILPDIGRDGHHASAGAHKQSGVACQETLHARLPRIPIGLVAGLRVDDILLRAIGGDDRGRSPRALADGRVEIPAHAIVESQPAVGLECVLHEKADVIAIDGRRADVLAVGEVGRGYGHGVVNGAAGEKARERIGQQIAGVNVVHAGF